MKEKTDQLIKDVGLKKQLHDILSNISLISYFNGIEKSKNMIAENLSNTKNLLDALKETVRFNLSSKLIN